MKYLAAFVDDNKELNAPDDKLEMHPSIAFFLSSYGKLATDEEGEIYRAQSEKNEIQDKLDQLFFENFGERMYQNDSGIDDALITTIIGFLKKTPSCKVIYLDHDLTLTCHHGLLDESILNAFYNTYITDSKSFNQYAGYFFGNIARYRKIKKFLAKLRNMGITIKILTKQPDTKSIECNMRLCKLDTFFDEYISSEKRKLEKLDLIQKDIEKINKGVRSPRINKNRSPKMLTKQTKKTKSPKKPKIGADKSRQ